MNWPRFAEKRERRSEQRHHAGPRAVTADRSFGRSRFWFGCAVLGVLLPAAAPPSAPRAPRSFTIEIKDLAFGPAPAGVRAGDTVEWVNDDILLHSVTARDKSFDMDVAPGARVRLVMKIPEVFHYFCKYHPGMTGEITVGR